MKGEIYIFRLTWYKSLIIFASVVAFLVISNAALAEDFVKTASDPSLIGIGARPIGMGKAYVGLADDASSVFLNPAGLAGLKEWQVLSMTTRLLNEIDYISFAGSYNTEYGTFGLGYVQASISGSFVTGLTLDDRLFPIVSEEAINYSSSVLIVGYGSEAKRFLSFDWLDKVSVGASLKIFSQGLSGGGISDGLLSGYDMDLGVLYKPQPWLSFGLNQIDILPVSMGGKLTSSSGVEHSLPTITRLGLAWKILGDNAYMPYPQQVIYLFDFDYSGTRANYPTLYRTGVEWWPSNYLALRMGFDQDVIGKDDSSGYGIDTNLAMGAGVQYNGFKFDYAYHKYGSITENDTSYISLSYASQIETAVPIAPVEEVKEQYLQIFTPRDKSTVYDEGMSIKGKVSNLKEVVSLTINNSNIQYSETGSFEVAYPLKLGKNIFDIKLIGKDGNVLAAEKVRLLRLVNFKDVPAGYWAKEPVETLATIGLIGGYPDGTFKPNKSISRAELTTLLVKARLSDATPESTNTQFKDVTKKHWASFFVKSGVDEGLVTGYPDKNFKPGKSLNRAEGITIITRFSQVKEPDMILEGPFSDVPGRHWAAKSITAARSAGLLQYLNGKPLEPNKQMTRAEAAEIISKTQFATTKINALKDFDTY